MAARKKNINENVIIPFLIMASSFLLRAYYVSYISINKNQHDGGIPYSFGHLGYISYFLDHNSFPDFNVSEVDQFWHPPLHYFLSARFLKLFWNVFPEQNGNFEVAQALPLLYVTISIFLIWMTTRIIFKESPLAQNIALLFIAFQPSFIIRSATINNDALTTMLVVACIFVLVCYTNSEKEWLIYLFLVLLCLGMWSKKSAIVAAIPAFFVVLIGIISDRNRKGLIRGLIAGIVTAPITFGWYFWMKLKWDIPFNFVWNVEDPTVLSDYISITDVKQRLLTFDLSQFRYANTFNTGNPYFEINPALVLLKTAANELWLWTYNIDDWVKRLSYATYISRTVIIVLAVLALLIFAIDRKYEFSLRVIIFAFFVVNVASVYGFAIQNPHICSMDFRYIEPVLICEGVMVAYLAKNKFIKWPLGAVVVFSGIATILKFVIYAGTI